MSVLVYIENSEGKFKKSGFEVVSYAKAIATQLGTSLTAISIGNVADDDLKSLGNYGVDKVLTVNHQNLKSFVNQAYAAIIAQAVKTLAIKVVVLSNSFSGKGLAPRIAVKLQAGLVDGAISLPDISEGNFVVKNNVFSSKAIAYVEITSPIKVVSLMPNAYKVVETGGLAELETFAYEASENDFTSIIKEIVKASDKVSLPDAEIVVSAGRGLKGPENWGMIEELAQLLGAAVACSKPVSDAHWRPHEEHVGQTGITVSPNLYIAIGISGAIQHLAGVSSSKIIVVINSDANAPFFKVADYGIVGDAFEIVPKLIAEVKAIKS